KSQKTNSKSQINLQNVKPIRNYSFWIWKLGFGTFCYLGFSHFWNLLFISTFAFFLKHNLTYKKLMDFNLSEEQLMIRDAARDFARTELLPGVIERDNLQKFPAEQVKKMGELGFLGMMVDPKYGGGGMDTVSYVLVMEELSKIDASCSVIVSVNNSLVCYGLEKYGSEDQKQKYLT